jgi:hypothetical protein
VTLLYYVRLRPSTTELRPALANHTRDYYRDHAHDHDHDHDYDYDYDYDY